MRKSLVSSSMFVLLLALAACESEAGASGVAGVADQVSEMLSGITSPETAREVQPQLKSMTDQLSSAMESAKSAVGGMAEKAGEAGGEAANDLGKMASDMAAKWITPEMKESLMGVKTQVERLLGNQEITNVIGPTLEKLQGLVAGIGG